MILRKISRGRVLDQEDLDAGYVTLESESVAFETKAPTNTKEFTIQMFGINEQGQKCTRNSKSACCVRAILT